MEPYVWDEWPQFFRGRLRVPSNLHGGRGNVIHYMWTRNGRAGQPAYGVTITVPVMFGCRLQ